MSISALINIVIANKIYVVINTNQPLKVLDLMAIGNYLIKGWKIEFN
jgi:hypothetical protein